MDEKDQLLTDLKLQVAQYERMCNELKQEIDKRGMVNQTMFSNLSHEIRTPLNGIIGFSEILSSTKVDSDELKLYAGVIQESSLLLLSILKDAFDIMRLDTGIFRAYTVPFDLNSLIYDIYTKYKPQAESKKIQFFLENLISEEFIISSDPDIIIRILVKLIENAIKFTKQGWVKLSYREDENQIVFSIEDTGIGISENLLSNLFTRFTTEEISKARHISGTGLDLTLCHGLVHLLGGEIEYESKSDQGSIFHFTIPQKTEPEG